MNGHITPGESLFRWILDRYKRQHCDTDSWIQSMSREFNMPDLEVFLMRSTALMILRRLLWSASWYETRFVDTTAAYDIFEKDYLLGVLGFDAEDRRQIISWIRRSRAASKHDIPDSLRRRLRARAEKVNQKCEISGCYIDYAVAVGPSAFSLDHIWPRSLGGSSDEWNLRIACSDCNTKRVNLAEAPDAHYELFHVKADWSSDRQSDFWTELSKDFRLAALLRANSRCEQCQAPVGEMQGGLDFLKVHSDENYHMFNVQVACGIHRR